MSGASAQPPLAAYGLLLDGLEGTARAVTPAGWPRWRVALRIEDADDSDGMTVTLRHARVGMPTLGEIRVSREDRAIDFAFRVPISAEALVHPGLVPAAAIVAWWDDRVPVHSSAILVDGQVWGLLADREGGKSTTAALLAELGCPLFADDMLIVDGRTAFAGPPAVDLRPEPAQILGGEALGVVGSRERWRKRFDVDTVEAQLRGWICLDWAQGTESRLAPLPVSERLAVLDRHISLPVAGDQLLAMAAIDMFTFTRPRGLEHAGQSAEALLAQIRAR